MARHADYMPEVVQGVMHAGRDRFHPERYYYHGESERHENNCRYTRIHPASFKNPFHLYPSVLIDVKYQPLSSTLKKGLKPYAVYEHIAGPLVAARVYDVL